MGKLSRSQFLLLGATGALAAVTTPVAAAQAPAVTPQGDDLGYLQWGATAELVSVAFWNRALRERGLGERGRRWIRAMRDGDAGHVRALRAVLGEETPTSDDFAVVLPRHAFASRARILSLGEEIEAHVTGVYLDGVSQALDPGTRLLLGRLLVNDVQHLDSLRALADGSSVFAQLSDPVDLESAGTWLDAFLRVRS